MRAQGMPETPPSEFSRGGNEATTTIGTRRGYALQNKQQARRCAKVAVLPLDLTKTTSDDLSNPTECPAGRTPMLELENAKRLLPELDLEVDLMPEVNRRKW